MNDLLDLFQDALDEFEAGCSDISSLIADLDSVLEELNSSASAQWIGLMRDQAVRLAALRDEIRQGGYKALWGPQHPVAVSCVHRLRTLIDEYEANGSPAELVRDSF